MRIALLAPDLAGHSGWSRYAADLGKALAELGHSVLAVVAREVEAPWCEQRAILRPPVDYVRAPILAVPDGLRLRRALGDWSPDAVHVMAEPYVTLLPFIRSTPPAWTTMHGTYAVAPFEGRWMLRALMHAGYRRATKIFAISEFTKRYVCSRLPRVFDEQGFEEKIRVMPNAIDIGDIPPPAGRARLDGPHRILSVGAVKDRKGYREALEAVAALRSRLPELRYDIIGALEDRAYADALRTRIAELGLEDAVQLRGEVDEPTLRRAYADADAFLLLSVHRGSAVEGFGLVFLEANAHGVPVVGPATGGCPEAIEEGKTGYVCDPADAETVAARLEDILVRRTITPEACRAWAEAHDVKTSAKRLTEEYARAGHPL